MINVTCAVIRNEEEDVLVVQRGEATDHPFKWEFPGGKMKDGETDEECIIREINEELSIDIVICGHMPEIEYDYGYKQIKLIPFVCDTLEDLPLLSEHIAFKWLPAGDLQKVDFSEADIIVASEYLKRFNEVKKSKEIIAGSVQAAVDDEELRSMINRMMSMKEAEWIATSAIAIKAYSMEILYKLALKYPELANELSASVNMLQGDGSAGVLARGRIIMKKLAEISKVPRKG